MFSYASVMYEALYRCVGLCNIQDNICPIRDILYTSRTEKLFNRNTGRKKINDRNSKLTKRSINKTNEGST